MTGVGHQLHHAITGSVYVTLIWHNSKAASQKPFAENLVIDVFLGDEPADGWSEQDHAVHGDRLPLGNGDANGALGLRGDLGSGLVRNRRVGTLVVLQGPRSSPRYRLARRCHAGLRIVGRTFHDVPLRANSLVMVQLRNFLPRHHGVGDGKPHNVADEQTHRVSAEARLDAVRACIHHAEAQQARRPPCRGGDLHEHDESPTKASAEPGGYEGFAHGKG